MILNMRKLVFHITHTGFLFCLGSTLPGQTTSWGQPSDVEHRVVGMFFTLWFLCLLSHDSCEGYSESVHTYYRGSSKDPRASPYCDDHPGSPPSSIPDAHRIGHVLFLSSQVVCPSLVYVASLLQPSVQLGSLELYTLIRKLWQF